MFKTYCEVDLLEIQRILTMFESKKIPKKVESAALFAQFNGKSFFQVKEKNLQLLKAIYNNLEDMEFKNEIDDDDNEIPNTDLLRLKSILMQKSEFKRGEDKVVSRTSVLDRSLQESSVRDAVLKIGRLCPQFSIFDLYCE